MRSSFDKDLAKGFYQLLEFKGDVESTYMRNFSHEYELFGTDKVVELKENGINIPLTNSNRQGCRHGLSRTYANVASYYFPLFFRICRLVYILYNK